MKSWSKTSSKGILNSKRKSKEMKSIYRKFISKTGILISYIENSGIKKLIDHTLRSLINEHVQGHRTRFETFQTNNFSWFNDILFKDQWFVGSWVVEIYAWLIIWNFFDLTQPQQPPMCKLVKKNWEKRVWM